MRFPLRILCVLVVLAAGCQNHPWLGLRDGPDEDSTAMPEVSLEQFAKEEGISRKEARDFFRKAHEELTPATSRD